VLESTEGACDMTTREEVAKGGESSHVPVRGSPGEYCIHAGPAESGQPYASRGGEGRVRGEERATHQREKGKSRLSNGGSLRHHPQP